MKTDKPNHGTGQTRANKIKPKGACWLDYAKKSSKKPETLLPAESPQSP